MQTDSTLDLNYIDCSEVQKKKTNIFICQDWEIASNNDRRYNIAYSYFPESHQTNWQINYFVDQNALNDKQKKHIEENFVFF